MKLTVANLKTYTKSITRRQNLLIEKVTGINNSNNNPHYLSLISMIEVEVTQANEEIHELKKIISFISSIRNGKLPGLIEEYLDLTEYPLPQTRDLLNNTKDSVSILPKSDLMHSFKELDIVVQFIERITYLAELEVLTM